MARVVTSISVFIASPSDVQSERKTVSSVITEWNTRYGRERNINFEVLKWENFSAGFGLDGQDVINSHLGNDYDVLIALFWARFGTPTPRATSGTNEEFGRAVDRFRSKGNVEIAALFKDAPIDFRTVDLEQVELVKQFEQEAQNAGAYTKTFRDADGLRFEVGILLDSVARKIFQNGA